jgi:hypothetical protein
MVEEGMIPGVPIDPDGFAYILGPDGKSRLDPKSTVTIDLGPTPRQ